MSVLGQDSVPAQHLDPWIVNVDDAKHWPQVRAAVWTEEQARAYVDHLFDFDSYQWAVEMGFVGVAAGASGGQGSGPVA